MKHRTPDLVKAILAAVVGTTLADRQIQNEERSVLRAIVEQFGLDEGDLVRAVEERPRPVLQEQGSGAALERMEVMRYAVLAAQADGKIDRREVGYLKDLGLRLGLTEPEWRDLEQLSTDIYHATRGGAVDDSNIREILRKYVG